jgi:hypothetical protein
MTGCDSEWDVVTQQSSTLVTLKIGLRVLPAVRLAPVFPSLGRHPNQWATWQRSQHCSGFSRREQGADYKPAYRESLASLKKSKPHALEYTVLVDQKVFEAAKNMNAHQHHQYGLDQEMHGEKLLRYILVG